MAGIDVLEAEYKRLTEILGDETVEELGALRRADLLRFELACGALVPGNEAAGRVQAHPLYLSSVVSWTPGPFEAELDPDGLDPRVRHGLPDGVRLMGAGQDVTFHSPAYEGTEVRVHAALIDVELKHGSKGSFLLGTLRRRFVDASDGTPLVTSVEKWIAR